METRRVRYIIFKRSRIFGGLWSHVSEAWRAINRRCFREDKKVSRQWVRDAITYPCGLRFLGGSFWNSKD